MVLCALGIESAAAHYDSILSLALAMATYTAGALLAGFFLAFTQKRIYASGLLWSAPLSMLMVFALVWHDPTSVKWVWTLLGLGAVLWIFLRLKPALEGSAFGNEIGPTLGYIALGALIGWTALHGHYGTRPDGSLKILAWPWYVPIGSLVALIGAWWLSPTRAKTQE